MVDTVVSTFVSLAFNPISGGPAVACRSGANNELSYYRWTGTGWSGETVDPTADPHNWSKQTV
jgi:hypothetical protein